MGKKKKAERAIGRQKELVSGMLKDIPTYEMSPEIQQMSDMLSEAAGEIKGLGALGEEAVDIARSQTGLAEAPGLGLAKEDIRQTSAQTVQQILEAGGGSAGILGAIGQSARAENEALRGLAAQNMAFKQQATQNLQGALTGQAQLQSGLLGQAAGLEATGLEAVAGEKQKEFESESNKYLTGLQFETTELGNRQQSLQNILNNRAQITSSIIGTAGKIGGAVVGAL